jgi:hypothetical protein
MVQIQFSNPINSEILKGMKKVDVHCHTNVSDGKNSAEELIQMAKKLNIGLSITDHNEIDGTIKACKSGIFSIPGIEATSADAIDFLLYFYSHRDIQEFYHKHIKHRHLKSRGFDLRKLHLSTEELLDAAREYNSVIVLPHPFTMRPKNSYKYIQKNPKYMKYIDGIEVLNSIMTQNSNANALAWAKEKNLAATGASDAHLIRHLGKTITAAHANNVEEFLQNIIKKKSIVVGETITGFDRIKAKLHILRSNLTW